MKSIEEAYVHRTPRSQAESTRLQRLMPGGSTRSVASYQPYPITLVTGAGGRVHDLDDNQYIDVLNNYTALVHGHAHPEVNRAVYEAMAYGSVFPAPHETQAELASLLINRLPAVERVRFTNSGSEAAVLASRVARHVTGRKGIVLFDGAYHGTGERFADLWPTVCRLPYNDVEALEQLTDAGVGAIFVEPFLGSGGVIPGRPEFLRAVQETAARLGALFILDEVQALRNHYHGTHADLGLSPDLVLLGKVIGGGLPIGAVGGRAEILDCLSTNAPRPLAHSGTFNGNVLSMVAGSTSMRLLTAEAIAQLEARAARLQESITEAAREGQVDLFVSRAGSILHVHLLRTERKTHGGPTVADPRLASLLHLALLTHGVYAAPRGMLNLSTAITDADIELLEVAYAEALVDVRKEGRFIT